MNSDALEGGYLGYYIGCSTDKLSRALTGIRTEIEKVIETPISRKELSRAKEYWLGRFELEMQRFSSQAMLFGLDQAYGLGHDHYRKVPDIIKGITAEAIREAAERYLKTSEPVISIVHDRDDIRDQVQEAWGSPLGTPSRGPENTTGNGLERARALQGPQR